MESAPNTSPRLKPAAPYSSDPRERFEAQRMEGDCKGHSPATRAAMAWIIAATIPDARASQLAAWTDAQLWQAAKAAHKANPEALHTLPESILQSIAWGEAVALQWGLRGQTEDLPTGPDLFAIINAASPGFGDAIKALVYDVDLPPFNELRWRFQSYVEDPFKPVFTNWLCLPWWPDQSPDESSALKKSLAMLEMPTDRR
ncbi:MAG: hypothetical protein AB7U71_24615 [Comamonas sp.]